MNRKILAIIFCLTGFSNFAFTQVEKFQCGTETADYAWEEHLQKLISAISNEQSRQSSGDYTIPVIFHVIHGGEPIGTYPNILHGQIRSQLTILNQDFSGNAYNSSNYPSNAFVNWAVNQNIQIANLDQNGRIKIADLNIQFCLATQDTSGNLLTEPGIDRVNYQSLGLPNPNLYATQATMKSYLDKVLKPQTIWDVTKYLNVWITDKNTSLTYAGVSSVPPLSGLMDIPNNSTDSTDGIWCYAKATGSYTLFPSGNYISQFIDGRTLTHEFGHYLGLRHIWGDAACGNDFCNDTPPAAGENNGTPFYPHNVGSCASNNPDGEMFMNFMDYTRGPGKYMFTTDQKTRVHTVMRNSPFRNQLGTHNLCSSATSIHDETMINQLVLYPNPAIDSINIRSENEKVNTVSIFNTLGILIQETESTQISLNNLSPGIYFFIIQTGKGIHSIKVSKI